MACTERCCFRKSRRSQIPNLSGLTLLEDRHQFSRTSLARPLKANALAPPQDNERTTSFFSAEGEFEDAEKGLDDLERDSDYSDIECKLLDQARELTDACIGSWELCSSSGGLEVHRRLELGGPPSTRRPLFMWRIRRVINAPPRAVFELIMDAEAQVSWNTVVAKVTNFGREHGATLLQTVFKGLGPVSGREGLEFRAATIPDAEPSYISYSSEGVEHLGIAVTPGCVRSFTNLSAYRISPGCTPDTTDLIFVSHFDAGGNVPDWVMKRAGAKGGVDLT
eukprot:CAMPEP_0194508024 /NCGR_PEP_ID=MMETSP0253-20130528/37845_1 /TAXON_ID=2966 /ORGANISM="Noctiluca scintillans" /LENGTH=279 /DNA_ID=CAMNT_0039350989 /DNA_START=52 /DNA_END=887 /DNA_ORIENTATION=+